MLTVRGWWFLTLATFILILGATGLPEYTVVPALIALTLIAWFLFEWVLFNLRVNTVVSKLRVTRRVYQGDREVPMVWAGLEFEVRVRVHHNAPMRIPFAVFEDRLPQVAQLTGGDNEEIADVSAEDPARIAYTLRAPTPGILRFDGVKVRLSDFHSFFYHRTFIPDEAEYMILPPLADDEGKQRADKRFNTLPPPGIHRLRRPGSGGELLDLRDYRPGDPPKMIAWKASARRDRLITKEYESDVPVRCVLFVDTSDGMRLGPPAHTPLAHMSGIASGVAQASAGNRDLVGMFTFDEHESKGVKPARTKIHMIGIMRRLAEVAGLQPSTKGVPPEHLTDRAHPLAMELYPQLMNKKTNSMPLGRLWLPMLDRWFGWIVVLWLLSPFMIPASIFFVRSVLPGFFPSLEEIRPLWPQRLWMEAIAYLTVTFTKWYGARQVWILFIPIPTKLFFFMFIWMFPAVTGLLFWFLYGFRGWFGERSRQLTKRKQLSALFALQDGSGPEGIERIIHDDAVYSERVGRFLQERQVRMPVPLYDELGRYRFRCKEKARVLANAMVQSVSRARDNELYVILADLAELGADLGPALKAAKLARARHHQVMIIVPWPADVPSPDDKPKEKPAEAKPKKKKKRGAMHHMNKPARLMPIVQEALTKQYHDAFRKFRRLFMQVGATVVRVNEGDAVQVVLDRLDRLRGMRSRR